MLQYDTIIYNRSKKKKYSIFMALSRQCWHLNTTEIISTEILYLENRLCEFIWFEFLSLKFPKGNFTVIEVVQFFSHTNSDRKVCRFLVANLNFFLCS